MSDWYDEMERAEQERDTQDYECYLAYKEGYNDAIDNFWIELVQEFDDDMCPNVSDYMDYTLSLRKLYKICERLKVGGENDL